VRRSKDARHIGLSPVGVSPVEAIYQRLAPVYDT
jgi:hypothetical protein